MKEAGVSSELVPLYVPAGLYEAMLVHLSSLLTRGGASDVLYARDGVSWSRDDVRAFAAAAERWPFAAEFVRAIAERSPKAVDVSEIADIFDVSSATIGGRLSGLGKWVKKRGKIRPGMDDATVWPFEFFYDRAGRAVYRMEEDVAAVVLDTLGD